MLKLLILVGVLSGNKISRKKLEKVEKLNLTEEIREKFNEWYYNNNQTRSYSGQEYCILDDIGDGCCTTDPWEAMEWADQMGEETQLHWAANGYNDCWVNDGQSTGCAYGKIFNKELIKPNLVDLVDFGCGREEDMGVNFLVVLFFGVFFLGPCVFALVIKSNSAAMNQTQNVIGNSMQPPIMLSTMSQQQPMIDQYQMMQQQQMVPQYSAPPQEPPPYSL